ncbi:MAG: UDP-glucose 6-dehydrogenase [Candidatus Coatesbacteria bacterium RBG_13_66_14]|uniref:UDP-glucose 6-dehydrogenase n=1 Tax=Candidatus Coatesbacteria bacterium RBG_13_66_14 TaxID=1817816 RepID=A0A1F5F4R3_9BACT|nr:MAG: UDP-glucose 6-dehydrogenase [Candidatus Coatesbacteria bacterium RBG_13_66_14]
MKLAVVGTGYVGLVTGACFADLGNEVICVDIDSKKIKALNEGRIPIYEPGLEEIVRRNADGGRLSFTTDLGDSVERSEIIFIAVGTPSMPSGEADLSAVRAVAATIGRHLNAPDKIVINKSTVPVGTGDMVTEIVARESGGKQPFHVLSNPEFLREGSAISDSMQPDRVVIGSNDTYAAEKVASLYRVLTKNIVITDRLSAEMIKYTSNALLATKISFINEIANICDLVGADVEAVADAAGLDHRLGRHFLNAGVGYGGSCFPKDTKALIDTAAKYGYDFKVLTAVEEVNALQPKRALAKINGLVGDLSGKVVALWGLAFKPNTDDMREAPSLTLIEGILAQGGRVRAYDPIAHETAAEELAKRNLAISFAGTMYEACDGADILVVVTEWNQFKDADLGRVKELLKKPAMVDGRNIYNPAEVAAMGFAYESMGRTSLAKRANG